ncbi:MULTISPECIES: GNAT family N-acetyltransferase [unclassified Hyphomonas]|jgi:GNAT superfamily N-acetyltransferase|uniref:GNAT family N-acetyltransferase n=1 Tax=unclassified Hyphomonas TaxID=2630699 RepID=UPI000C6162EE|nr:MULTISPECIES: GNAT family N-acetyltransferase [unclassified Hyphomonas]MAN90240.1 GNAT family N-acetyltransferase [Hyphomonadaceae bacterium]MAA81932.1 GNAT family N-acetyltransferase [Hyphomonas sp.]MAL43451.1 GNAT family N-acetyltransferase [Hyphomonas sp.]MAX82747.1 GNAT family N-acetyltransferase [Hyphomonas sp.]MBG66885.1 GNAT family N-acetyltransferase [Hyphomonas sp.]
MSMQHASTRYGIDDADASEVGVLAEVDRAASALFAPTGLLSAEALKDHVPIDILASAAENGDLFTARLDTGAPVGFALVSLRGGMLYLDQISVHPDQGQRGIGAALLTRVIDEAKRRKLRRVALSTFRDLPWNAPFYAKHGFREIRRSDMAEWMLELERIQAEELDVSKRCFMVRKIGWL